MTDISQILPIYFKRLRLLRELLKHFQSKLDFWVAVHLLDIALFNMNSVLFVQHGQFLSVQRTRAISIENFEHIGCFLFL